MKFPVVKVSVAPDDLGHTLAHEVFSKLYSLDLLGHSFLYFDLKVRVSFKVGKKRKLRNIRFKTLGYMDRCCSCCHGSFEYEYQTIPKHVPFEGFNWNTLKYDSSKPNPKPW